jgi:hypothetical protein
MNSIIPKQVKGKSLDLEERISEKNIEQAIKTFQRASKRLLNPPVWHLLAGELSAKFAIHNPQNKKKSDLRLAQINDYFTVDIPAPSNIEGYGHDWVKVEDLQNNKIPNCDESVAMTLRASENPIKHEDNAAHFFDKNATSTFIIRRIGKVVYASYHGRNEIENTKVISLIDKIRNFFVATAAKKLFSKFQWSALLKGFLQPEIGG